MKLKSLASFLGFEHYPQPLKLLAGEFLPIKPAQSFYHILTEIVKKP
jgi:hypothetical protein